MCSYLRLSGRIKGRVIRHYTVGTDYFSKAFLPPLELSNLASDRIKTEYAGLNLIGGRRDAISVGTGHLSVDGFRFVSL